MKPGARVAPHPFTTIEPNHGTGWFAASTLAPPADAAPGAPLAEARAAPEHGRAPGGARLLPLVIKDVAGLVPGARDGRGRGNQFLNDLVDADVLIHVVDASGRSDREGVEGGEGSGDPLDDVMWVRDEIHGWIFTNVRRKWATIKRRPAKLAAMFSGYGADRALVRQSLADAGISLDALEARAAARAAASPHALAADAGPLPRLASPAGPCTSLRTATTSLTSTPSSGSAICRS